MFSILELIPKDLVEKLKTLEVEELPSYVRYIKEVVKEKISTVLCYKNYNLEVLAEIPEFPYRVGLFWVGKLNKRMKLMQKRTDPLVIYSFWDRDLFLFPTIVFKKHEDLEEFLKRTEFHNYPFLYREGEIYYYENFLPLGTKEHSSISVFYQKLYPLL